MSRNDSAESTGAFRPGLATHLADARTSESTGFSESWRGTLGSAEHLKLAEAICSWFHQRFQKTPAYTAACASDKNPRVYH
jgi:hypothetical protein